MTNDEYKAYVKKCSLSELNLMFKSTDKTKFSERVIIIENEIQTRPIVDSENSEIQLDPKLKKYSIAGFLLGPIWGLPNISTVFGSVIPQSGMD